MVPTMIYDFRGPGICPHGRQPVTWSIFTRSRAKSFILTPEFNMRPLTRHALIIAATTLPSVLSGQGLTVQSVVDVRFQGALGAIVRVAARFGGASMHDVATTTYLQGHRMRTETSADGMIIDLDGERVTNIDHKQKSFSSMTFAEMSAAIQQATQKGEQERAKNTKTPKDARQEPAKSKDSVSVKYKVAVDRTGQREKVAGYDAERVFITLTMEAEATPEGGSTEQAGSMVFLIDQWISKSAPQIAAYSEFYRAYSQKVGREFRTQAQGLQSAFTADPRIKQGFEAAAKELQKVQGIALRSTTHVVVLPPGMALDRQLALGEATAAAAKEEGAKKEEKPKGGLRGLMGAVKAAAADAGKQSEDNSKKSAPATQSTLLVLFDEVKSISTGAVPEDVFAAPAGYREVKRQAP